MSDTILRHFRGYRDENGNTAVFIEQQPLSPRYDLRNHSPCGFEWGYPGSGPAQLALALLCEALGDDQAAQAFYQDFKREVVCYLPRDGWTLSQCSIVAWMESDPNRTGFLERN